jgi:hypothetical protein
VPVKRSVIPLHIQYGCIYTWRNSPLFFLPFWLPFAPPFVSPSTSLAPSSCDRNRPPQSRVACKLTPFAPPSPNPPLPSKFPKPQLPSALLRRPREYFALAKRNSTAVIGTAVLKTGWFYLNHCLVWKVRVWLLPVPLC